MKSMFLLFSHNLTEDQREDARKSLGVDSIINLPDELKNIWSQIPPDSVTITQQVETILQWLLANATKGDYVLIQGEYGATYYLINFANAQGYIPIYSTTKRDSLEHLLPDGTVKTEHIIKHVMYRKYLESGPAVNDEISFDECCTRFSRKYNALIQEKGIGPYDYLIIPVGFSSDPLVMLIKAVRPKKVFFLHSSDSKKIIDEIVERTNLKTTQIKYKEVSNILEVYQTIKNFIENEKLESKLKNIIIDITGGKKSMVSGCSQAASYLKIDTIYVDNNDYDKEKRRPRPGSEIPILIDNPQEVFGDRELSDAKAKFDSGDFVSSRDSFASIIPRALRPKLFEVYKALAEGYKAMEDMDFSTAYTKLNSVQQHVENFNLNQLPIHDINNHLVALNTVKDIKELSEKKIFKDKDILFNILAYTMAMARHYLNQEKLDFASLLTYRSLELLVQYLLMLFNVYSSKVCYKDLGISQETILEKLNDLIKNTCQRDGTYNELKELPSKLTLIMGVMLLIILAEHDTQVQNINLVEKIRSLFNKEKLLWIIDTTQLRNKSRFAHGFSDIKKEEVKGFYYKVRKYCSEIVDEELTDNSNIKFEDILKRFSFIKLRS